MENWNNLNRFISLEQKEKERHQDLSQKLVDLSMKGDKKSLAEILKKGISPNCYESTDLLTPLIAAVKSDQLEIAKFLLKVGATVSYRPHGTDALWEALRAKAHHFLEIFIANKCVLTLEKDPKDIYPSNIKRNPLEEEKPEKVEPNNTALIYATKQSDVKSVEILLRHYNIKVNERDSLGNTALHYNVYKATLSEEDIEIGRMLLAAGADANSTNLDGLTPEDMTQDYAAKSMLLAGKLENELELPEPEVENVENKPKKIFKI